MAAHQESLQKPLISGDRGGFRDQKAQSGSGFQLESRGTSVNHFNVPVQSRHDNNTITLVLIDNVMFFLIPYDITQ